MYKNVLDFFVETVKRTPNKNAVIHGERSISFAELDLKSQILASSILDRISDDICTPIAVFLPKGIEVFISDIAILYSANFYSNLDVKTPPERIGNIIHLMKPGLIITDNQNIKVLHQIDDLATDILNISDFEWESPVVNCDRMQKRLNERIDTDPLCIINTSGSTGTPKGVVLNHRSFFDFLNWSFDTFHFEGNEIIGSLSPIVFDIYDFELCFMMFKGASIVLLDAMLAAFPARLLEEVRDKKISFIFWVPTIMVNIANMGLLDRIQLPDLKTVWFAGEVFPTKQFNVWRKHLKDVIFANLYGPIEITLDCIYYIVDHELSDDEPLPIGYPCKNTDILILNDEDKLCKPNEIGEICVRGTSLAMGYYNDLEKTSEVFVQNPLNTAYPELIYRTGDLAYQDSVGLIMFKGRKDSLIKHMGYRIELGEIEHIIVNKLKLVKNCCAVYHYEKKEIILFYEKGSNVTELDIRKMLMKEFPRYMLPSSYIELEELPRNTNGKIDRLLLGRKVNH